MIQQYKKALEAYNRVIQIKEDFAEAHLMIAYIKKYLGVYDESIVYYQNAMKFKEDFKKDPSIWYELGCVYYELKCYDKAIKAFKQALLFAPNDPMILYNLDLVYEQLKSDLK